MAAAGRKQTVLFEMQDVFTKRELSAERAPCLENDFAQNPVILSRDWDLPEQSGPSGLPRPI